MLAIRTIHIRHFHPRRKRFTSEAFKRFGDGISVFDHECALGVSGDVCGHIRRFYQPGAASEPPIYWAFDTGSLPSGHRLVRETSASGDDCHYDIRDMSNTAARSFFKPFNEAFEQFLVCRPDGPASPPTRSELVEMERQFAAVP